LESSHAAALGVSVGAAIVRNAGAAAVNAHAEQLQADSINRAGGLIVKALSQNMKGASSFEIRIVAPSRFVEIA
jgi:hypothetical protein